MPVSTGQSRYMHGVVPAAKFIGGEVVNQQGENMGQIHELVIDARDGRLAYAVLSLGGLLGRGNKLFAIPWCTLEFSNAGNKCVLKVDKQRLEIAPGFDKDAEWPNFADRIWGDRLYKCYGCEPYWMRHFDDPGAC